MPGRIDAWDPALVCTCDASPIRIPMVCSRTCHRDRGGALDQRSEGAPGPDRPVRPGGLEAAGLAPLRPGLARPPVAPGEMSA